MRFFVAVLLVSGLLTACGLKGSLHSPENQITQVSSSVSNGVE